MSCLKKGCLQKSWLKKSCLQKISLQKGRLLACRRRLAARAASAGYRGTSCAGGCRWLRGTRGICGAIENAAHPALRPELRYNRDNELQIQAKTGIGRMR